ncbi:MAG: GNAT family N-acetyltransferase [Planctomycetes bacterium]|nr:GNAT family N-acetyltransferase [Planctomycetota bacterium]
MDSAPALRPIDPVRDAPALHAIFGDDESCRYMPEPALATVAQTQALLERWTTGHEDSSWAVCEEPDGRALGRVALVPRGPEIWEAACMICPAARGRRLAARSLALVLNQAFDARGARRVFADIDPDNVASVRTFEVLGFRLEGRLRASWKTHIGVRDSLIYGLLASDPRPWHT